MTSGDGNGWVRCRCGHRHWGRYGAAGLLLVRRSPGAGGDGPVSASNEALDPHSAPSEALLQLRASWTDAGGTWGLPGGAADSHEDPTASALREAAEETGLDAAAVAVLGEEVTTDHGDWRYTVVVATPVTAVNPRAANAESDEVAWVDIDAVAGLPLHQGLASSWPRLVDVVHALTGPVT